MRFGAAFALVPERRVDREIAKTSELGLAVTARFDVSAPTGDRTQFAGEPGGAYAPSVTVGATYDRFYASAEIGGRLRGVSQFAGARIGSQAVFGLGVGAHVLRASPQRVRGKRGRSRPSRRSSTPCRRRAGS
ncbi:MAG: hypothetical protein U0235_19550 [Polyangiaceae bacterium]